VRQILLPLDTTMTTMNEGESSSEYYTLAQQVALTIGTSLTACLSIAGSTAIVYVIYVDHRRKKASHNVKNRLLLGLCLSDILNSLVYVFWALAIPEGTPSGKLVVCMCGCGRCYVAFHIESKLLRRTNYSVVFRFYPTVTKYTELYSPSCNRL
jgi:hypothetical protein